MITESNDKTNTPHIEIINSFFETNQEAEVIFPDEETIEKELEQYRLYLISKHLPDHCVQLIYLS